MYRLIVIMTVGIIKRDVFKCERCNYEWFSHKYTAENPPIACAKCKSPYWNKPRQEAKKQEIGFKEKRKLK